MKLKAAFIFISAEGNPLVHKNETDTGSVSVTTFAVQNYEMTCLLAKKLLDDGFNAIELCGGFGAQGVAAVKTAVEGKIPVGVVRFEHHPGLGFKSGDECFG